jgi:hypothetical protein
MTCPRSARYAWPHSRGGRASLSAAGIATFGSVAAPMRSAARLQGDNHILVAEQETASSAWSN